MIHFTNLKEIITAHMDADVMHCTYDYAFAADTVTLIFHAPNDETQVVKRFVYENASGSMSQICKDTLRFLTTCAVCGLIEGCHVSGCSNDLEAEHICDALCTPETCWLHRPMPRKIN